MVLQGKDAETNSRQTSFLMQDKHAKPLQILFPCWLMGLKDGQDLSSSIHLYFSLFKKYEGRGHPAGSVGGICDS